MYVDDLIIKVTSQKGKCQIGGGAEKMEGWRHCVTGGAAGAGSSSEGIS